MSARLAIVAGAGIGGLAAAIALRRSGFDVKVFERSPELREVGSGVAIQPNGTRALEALGVAGLPSSGLSGLALRSSNGRRLSDTPLGLFRERYGADFLVVPRSELLATLLQCLGRDLVTTGAEITAYCQEHRVR